MKAALTERAPAPPAEAPAYQPGPQAGLGAMLDKPLVFVGGKGGVGKTTLAAALGLALAARHPERKVLLLSIDPAHSLNKVLGEAPSGLGLLPNVKVVELQAEPVFEEFRQRHREGLGKIALRGTFLEESDLQHFLEAGLPGLDELAALKVISESVRARAADHIIVDTAPTGHTLRLLTLPEVVRQWREALDALMVKHRLLAALYARRYVPDEADEVIEELRKIHTLFRQTLSDNQAAAFVPVMNPDPLALAETRRLLDALNRLGVSVPCVLLNKVRPPNEACPVCTRLCDKEAEWGRKARAELRPPVVDVPRLSREPRGQWALANLGEFLLTGMVPLAETRLYASQPVNWRAQAHASSLPALAEPPILPGGSASGTTTTRITESPCIHPAQSLATSTLILVCGKGGVGKTTVASALALRLARNSKARILLFSTAPAHSLADALGQRIGPEPTRVIQGLDAVEIDPVSRMERLRETYRHEIGELFASLLGSEQLDDTLDRQAMERLIDLSPPGLDEIMALAELSRYLPENVYTQFVIDTPPTGHFLRFLELPGLVRAWLAAFFEIFLKYKSLARVPRIQTLLVTLSKEIKEFQRLLACTGSTAILPVAMPTALAFAQTRELLARTAQMEMMAPVGVLNHLATPSRGCADCARRVTRSEYFVTRYKDAFPELPFLSLAEQAENVTGLPQLERIGALLFP